MVRKHRGDYEQEKDGDSTCKGPGVGMNLSYLSTAFVVRVHKQRCNQWEETCAAGREGSHKTFCGALEVNLALHSTRGSIEAQIE